MIRSLLRSQDFFLWRALAFLIERPGRWRLFRLAGAGIRFNRWRLRLKSLGDDSVIYSNVVIHRPERVSIGRNAAIAEFVHMWGGGGISIGRNVMIASHAVVTSQTHGTHPAARRENVSKSVVIGDDVWIGAAAIILPGVTIGDEAVVAAGAVVAQDVAPRAIVAGVPAKQVRFVGNEPA